MTDEIASNNPRQVGLSRIFLRDASIEVPLAPQIFLRNGTPQVDLDISTSAAKAEGDLFQVVLAVTVTARFEQETAFLVEIHQAGLFELIGFPPHELPAMLGSYCPTQLFPYARETISNLVSRTGFPPIFLQPINFDALFNEHMKRSVANGSLQPGNDPALPS
jgi:preprotein translocase subunit SecB